MNRVLNGKEDEKDIRKLFMDFGMTGPWTIFNSDGFSGFGWGKDHGEWEWTVSKPMTKKMIQDAITIWYKRLIKELNKL